MTNVEILKLAKERISKPESWTQNYKARTKQGLPCDFRSQYAAAFCVIGAVQSVQVTSGVSKWGALGALNVTLRSRNHFTGTVTYNDDPSRKHSEIISLFDETIERLERLEKENAK